MKPLKPRLTTIVTCSLLSCHIYPLFSQTITLNTTLSPFTTCEKVPSPVQNVSISATGLTKSIKIGVSQFYEFLNADGSRIDSLPSSGGTLGIRLKDGKSMGSYNENIQLTSDSTTQSLNLIGSVTTTFTPSVTIDPAYTTPGNKSFSATASNTGGGTITYHFRKNDNTISAHGNVSDATDLVVGDVVTCEISITEGQCLTKTTASTTTSVMDEDFDLQFVGNGNIQQSLNESTQIPANTGAGVIISEQLPRLWQGILSRKNKKENGRGFRSLELELIYQFASTVDTIQAQRDPKGNVTNKENFGSSILTPRNSREGFYALWKAYFSNKYAPTKIIAGCYGGFSYSARNWSDSAQFIKAKVMTLTVGLFHEFVPEKGNLRKNYSVVLGCGYTGRFLGGAISQESHEDFRKEVLGTIQNNYSGIEFLIAARLRNIKLEVHIPCLWSTHEQVEGLTGFNPYNFIGFTGGFPLKLN